MQDSIARLSTIPIINYEITKISIKDIGKTNKGFLVEPNLEGPKDSSNIMI